MYIFAGKTAFRSFYPRVYITINLSPVFQFVVSLFVIYNRIDFVECDLLDIVAAEKSGERWQKTTSILLHLVKDS